MTVSHATQPCVLSPADVDLFVEAFLARWESPNTRAAYRQDLTAWLRWCHLHGKHPISDASRPLVEMWMRWLRDERGNSASTINHRVGTLTRFFELALDDDLVAKNPCRLVRRPKAGSDNNDRIALTRDEMQRLTAAAVAVSPHVLRHTFVVGALDAGAQPRTVQLSARHAQISTTLDVYDKGRQALDDHAAYVVAGYFGSAA
ncbi:tyrosine integrase [Gordonia phage Sekhmet]|uniref:Integrase n=1 Tax=Gordonia phage Sekhmet TaxID=2591209 RepID=A0A514DIF7_9CAUD|nr:tyrosine integrase [Gordonia phage Sekhmet]QDH93375.1 tyrosine integrase [Gordonia phage Sekhmet]